MVRLALAVLLLTSAGLGEASACNFVNFRFFFGTDSNTDMTARSGQPCSMPLITGGRASYSASDQQATTRRHGARRLLGCHLPVETRLQRADLFAFTVSGTTPHGTGSTTVEMRVTVE